MKKLFLTLLVVAVAFASCKKDDDKKNNGNGGTTTDNSAWIVGTWDAINVDGEEIPSDLIKISYTFEKIIGEYGNGSTYTYFLLDPDMPPMEETNYMEYKLNKDNTILYVRAKGEQEESEVKITKHSNSNMTIEGQKDIETGATNLMEFKKR